MTTQHRLVVVDLVGSASSRWLVSRRARRYIRGLTHSGSGDLPRILLHDPGGAALGSSWSRQGGLVQPSEVLEPEISQEIREWCYEASFALVESRGGTLFPARRGVNLGELNLLTIQRHLASVALLLESLRRILALRPADNCAIFSADWCVEEALKQAAVERVATVTSWSPRGLQRLRSILTCGFAEPRRAATLAQQHRDSALEELVLQSIPDHTAPVLLFADSRPMQQMFDVVRENLDAAGMEAIVTLHLGKAPRNPPAGALWLGKFLEGARLGTFMRQWRQTASMLAQVKLPDPPAGAFGAPLLQSLLENLYRHELPRQAAYVEAVDATLERLRPSIVVVGNDRWWPGQTLVSVAKARGIPTLAVQDGMAGDSETWWWTAADHVAASSEVWAEGLRRHGFPESRFTVTGQARYDRLYPHLAEGDTARAREALGVDPNVPVVLFTTQPEQDRAYLTEVCRAILAVPDVRLMLRPHPSEDHRPHRRLLRSEGSERITLHEHEDIIDLLRAADIVVAQFSTVVVEAAMLGKPVLTANFSGGPDPFPFAEFELARRVRNCEHLTTAIQTLLASGTARRLTSKAKAGIDRLAGPVDGKAGERIAALIASMRRGSAGYAGRTSRAGEPRGRGGRSAPAMP